jgi:anaerobic ribonucleoside-triphosphate reductase
MGRLGYEARDYEDLIVRLDELLDMARRSLITKGIFIEQHKDRFMPLDKIYGTDLTRFFRTIGICGLEEMTMNFEGKHLSEDPQLSVDVLNHLRDWTRITQQTTGVLWNIEMTPAESTASDFGEKDKRIYPDIYDYSTKSGNDYVGKNQCGTTDYSIIHWRNSKQILSRRK